MWNFVDDLTLRRPVRDAHPERLPHIHAGRLGAFTLPAVIGAEEFVQRLPLAFPAKTRRLGSLQMQIYRQELLLVLVWISSTRMCLSGGFRR